MLMSETKSKAFVSLSKRSHIVFDNLMSRLKHIDTMDECNNVSIITNDLTWRDTSAETVINHDSLNDLQSQLGHLR
jgi:hypothetical protein